MKKAEWIRITLIAVLAITSLSVGLASAAQAPAVTGAE